MEHILPPLPFKENALEPYISKKTIEYHYGKHHKAYIDNLNKLLINYPEFKDKNLEYIVKHSDGSVFNNAAQAWNHNFFWRCLSGDSQKEPAHDLSHAINQRWSSFKLFKAEFQVAALSHFGSGWTWLVKKRDSSLEILSTKNAQTPLTGDDVPLLTIDVWEHAYYIDYFNARFDFIEAFWHVVNWNFVEKNFTS